MDKKGKGSKPSASGDKITIGEMLVCLGIIIVILGCGFGYYMDFNGNLLYSLLAIVATMGASIGLAYFVSYTKRQKSFAAKWQIFRYAAVGVYIVVAVFAIAYGMNKTGVILSNRDKLANAYKDDCAAIKSAVDSFIEKERVAITDMTNGIANHSTFYFRIGDEKSQETFKAWGLKESTAYNSSDFYQLSAKLKESKEKSLEEVIDYMGRYYNPSHGSYDPRLKSSDQTLSSPFPIQLPAVAENLKSMAKDVNNSMRNRHEFLHLYLMKESGGSFSLEEIAYEDIKPLASSKLESVITSVSGISVWAILLGIVAFTLIILPSLVAPSLNTTYKGRTPKGGFPI